MKLRYENLKNKPTVRSTKNGFLMTANALSCCIAGLAKHEKSWAVEYPDLPLRDQEASKQDHT